MRRWPTLVLALHAAACGQSAKRAPASCSSLCVPPSLATLDLLAGRPGAPLGWVDGTRVAAHFDDPWAIVGDGQGHLYVADGRYTVRAIDIAAGSVATLAGVHGQIGSADGVGASATFNTPSGLAFTPRALYLTDSENGTVRQIDVASRAVTTLAGASGQVGAVDGIGADARFALPQGLAADASGNLYIGDTENNTIRKLDIPSGVVSTVAGTAGVTGNTDGPAATALLNRPNALAIDAAGNVYVADSLNQSIRKIDPATAMVSTWVVFGTPPQGAVPEGLVVDGSDVLVSLSDNRVVRVSAGGVVTALAGGAGPPGFVDGAGSDARFDAPAGLWNDGAGTLYVADERNAVVRAIDLGSATVSTYAGVESRGHADGTGARAQFAGPQGLALDDRTVYVADTDNDTIRMIVLATGQVTTLAGAVGQPGSVDGQLSEARFNQPQGLALDRAAQQLYVADTKNRSVRRIDLAAGTVSTLAHTPAPGDPFRGFDAPAGLAFDGGRLFVTDYVDDAVMAIDLQKAQVSTLAGTSGAPGYADGVGSKAAFYGPFGIAADGRGNLYVADYLDQSIREIAIATATVSTLAGQPVIPGNSDGVRSGAHFHGPIGVAADRNGDVFVSDSLNNAVRRVDASTGAVTTIIGSSVASGVRLGALPAQLTGPSALALTDTGGLLLVSENAVLLAH